MKTDRQNAIIDIIENNAVETQEELIAKLAERGFIVTQATVSRDIRELKLVKVTGELGKYKYIVPPTGSEENQHIYAAFASSVRSVEAAMNLVVIKTYPGLAQALAASPDSQNELDIAGCVAGDDTIFAAAYTTDSAKEIANKIRNDIKSV